jgi:hypothetical protein
MSHCRLKRTIFGEQEKQHVTKTYATAVAKVVDSESGLLRLDFQHKSLR